MLHLLVIGTWVYIIYNMTYIIIIIYLIIIKLLTLCAGFGAHLSIYHSRAPRPDSVPKAAGSRVTSHLVSLLSRFPLYTVCAYLYIIIYKDIISLFVVVVVRPRKKW